MHTNKIKKAHMLHIKVIHLIRVSFMKHCFYFNDCQLMLYLVLIS